MVPIYYQDIGDWNVANVVDMRYMFSGANLLSYDNKRIIHQ